MKPFSQWTKEEVETEFNLRMEPDNQKLQDWLTAQRHTPYDGLDNQE
jgi:hypothetical protein